jgi:hypothetical protein
MPDLVSTGIFLVDLDILPKAESTQLGEAMRRGAWECPSHPDLSVPFTAAMWALKGQPSQPCTTSKKGQDLSKIFDIVVDTQKRWALYRCLPVQDRTRTRKQISRFSGRHTELFHFFREKTHEHVSSAHHHKLTDRV